MLEECISSWLICQKCLSLRCGRHSWLKTAGALWKQFRSSWHVTGFKCRFWASLNLTADVDYTTLSGCLTSASYLEAALDINGAGFWAPTLKYWCSFTFCAQTEKWYRIHPYKKYCSGQYHVMSPLHIWLFRIITIFRHHSIYMALQCTRVKAIQQLTLTICFLFSLNRIGS